MKGFTTTSNYTLITLQQIEIECFSIRLNIWTSVWPDPSLFLSGLQINKSRWISRSRTEDPHAAVGHCGTGEVHEVILLELYIYFSLFIILSSSGSSLLSGFGVWRRRSLEMQWVSSSCLTSLMNKVSSTSETGWVSPLIFHSELYTSFFGCF